MLSKRVQEKVLYGNETLYFFQKKNSRFSNRKNRKQNIQENYQLFIIHCDCYTAEYSWTRWSRKTFFLVCFCLFLYLMLGTNLTEMGFTTLKYLVSKWLHPKKNHAAVNYLNFVLMVKRSLKQSFWKVAGKKKSNCAGFLGTNLWKNWPTLQILPKSTWFCGYFQGKFH